MKNKILTLFLVVMSCWVVAFGVEAEEKPTGGYMPIIEELESFEIPENKSVSDDLMFSVERISENVEISGEISSSDYYGYTTLLKEDKRLANAYTYLLEKMLERDEYIYPIGYTLTLDEFHKVFNACINDWPQLFYLRTGYRYGMTGKYVSIAAPYYIEYLNLSDNKEIFESAANKIIEESGVRPEMSDYDKAVMLHDELTSDVEYDYDVLNLYNEAYKIADVEERKAEIARLDGLYSHIHSAYGALVYGKAVCDGYSRAYQYLLYKMGILSHIATGTAGGEGHAWNLVCLDGKWYYTDLTWDDSDNAIKFYEYFNITDEKLASCDHETNNPYELPECISNEHNYFTVNGGNIKGEGDMDEVVRQLKENSYARIYVTDDADFDVWQWYKDNISKIGQRLGIKSGFSYGLESSGREYHLKLFHDTLHPVKNIGLEICSTTDKECRILIGFYDENDRLIDMYESEVESLEANKIKYIKYKKAPKHFKHVKYFVWDKDGGLIPLYHDATMDY